MSGVLVFSWCWGTEPRPRTCSAGTLPLSHTPSQLFTFGDRLALSTLCSLLSWLNCCAELLVLAPGALRTVVASVGRQPVKMCVNGPTLPGQNSHCHPYPDIQPQPNSPCLWLLEDILSLSVSPGSGAVPSVWLSSSEERASGCL